MTVQREQERGDTGEVARRRRGAALEKAILDVTWEELLERGYGALTFEAVALRAGTSRPVLARRWPNRSDLALAAIRHRMATHPLHVPDMGNVREELLCFLKQSVERGWPFAMMFACQMGEYYRETNTTVHQLRDAMSTVEENAIFNILHRAIQRGEVDGRKLTPTIVRLPKEMLFNNAMRTLKPTSEETILEIIDTIFLPLVKASPSDGSSGKS